MFTQNKYLKWYENIIARAKERTLEKPYDRHHIIPKSLGGKNSSSNLVALTLREHFICHLLLIRFVDATVKHKMVYAAWQQSRSFKFSGKVTSRVYAYLRAELSKTYTGRKRNPFTDTWKQNMSIRAQGSKNNMFGKRHSAATKEKISANRKGMCAGSNNPFYDKKHSVEVSKKLSAKNTTVFSGVPKMRVCCIHCKKEVSHNMINRYHGDNCKFKS
jgi:hypothetical protein